MKKLSLLYAGILYASLLPAQPSFQTSLEAGISLPLNSNNINATHTGKAIHFGNHLDYAFGNNNIRFGLGAYIGYINALSADSKYKQVGEAIAEKYRFTTTGLTFNSSEFKSTHILIGPVASFGSDKFNINVWAKGGYGLNEPSRYAVVYKDNGVVNNVYINQSGEHKNGLAYSAGAGIKLAISEYAGFKLSAGYFSTQTDQINYNFDREKGTTPLYYTASNQFIQVSAGLQFSIGNAGRHNAASLSRDTSNPPAARIDQKTKSNIKNNLVTNTLADAGAQERQIIKSKSNVKNNRLANDNGNDADDYTGTDSLLFTPQKIELRAKISDDAMNRIQLQSVDNYLTGFLYKTANGAVLNQCGAMDSDPIPGVDVHLKRAGAAANDVLTARTNKDGSFSFNNIAPGNYNADAGAAAMAVTVNGNNDNAFKTLDIQGGSCGDTKQNYIITAGDKTFVEVISAGEAGKKHVANIKWNDISVAAPRDAATGMATGKRMHKPYLTSNMQFDINQRNIVTSDGKLYAEVITAREAGSGMATGRSVIVTGDVDGDGFEDNAVVSSRDAASGLPTGKRMHKPYVITKELDLTENEIVSPRDAASGLPTGRRMHKPVVIIKEIDRNYEIVSPRDASSGLPTGKRMHKPFVVTVDEDEEAEEIVSPRGASSGMHTGKRMHKPYIISIDPDANTYKVLSPRDAASGLPTGKRMHKPFVITKELDLTNDGDEVVTYSIIRRDFPAENDAAAEDDDAGAEDAAAIESNPLYQGSGTGGVNPLFEAKNDLRVAGSNGILHDIFIPANFTVIPANDQLSEYTTSNIGPIRWMSPESINNRAAGKSINEKGIKRSEAAKKGITEKGIKLAPDKMEAGSERKGWDGSVKGSGKGINEAGIKVIEDAAARKGWDGTVKGGSFTDAAARKGWDGTVKGGAVVESMNRIRCADGTCAIEAIVTVDGVEYEAVISGVLKTKHDTVKNSIGNIR